MERNNAISEMNVIDTLLTIIDIIWHLKIVSVGECVFGIILLFTLFIFSDYVTEKFWRLKQLIVPIVLRRSDYLHLAPNHSYIAVDDFRSPMQLANYLKTTSDNETQYLKYFEWTRIYRRKNRSNNPYCQLCEHLHNRTVVTKSYDMNQWWKVDGNCQMGYAHQFLNN
jgi:alpha-1,3-fucosyltransferase